MRTAQLVAVAVVLGAVVAAALPWTNAVADSEPATITGAGDQAFPPWWPHHHHNGKPGYREVFMFNLMDFVPAPAREFICLIAGCPNFAVLESLSVRSHEQAMAAHVGNFSSEQDLLVVLSSTVGLPTTVLAFFKDSLDFKRGNWDEAIAKAILDGNFDGVVDMKGSSFAMGTVFHSVIEYKDVDGDDKFTPNVDEVRSTYPLLDAKWAAMEAKEVLDKANNDTIVSLNATTLDGVFSLQFNIASSTLHINHLTSLNPNSTKIDVKIKDYPYSAAGLGDDNSRLTVKTLVVSADAKYKLSIENDEHIKVGEEGYFEWVDVADVKDETVEVASSFDPTPTAAAGDLDGTILQLVMDVDKVTKVDGTMKTVYMSFNATNPPEVYWDPSLGYDFDATPDVGPPSGPQPGEPWAQKHWWAIALIGAGVVTIGAAMAVVVLRRRRGKNGERQPLVGGSQGSSNGGAVDP